MTFNPRAFSRRNAWLRANYDIDHEEYEWMLSKQGGVCAICGTNDPGRGNEHFTVDHDHATGENRGILCHVCNSVLGLMADDPERLRVAAEYLERT